MQIVKFQVKLSKRKMYFLYALSQLDKVIQLKLTDKIRMHTLKRSIKLVPVHDKQSTAES